MTGDCHAPFCGSPGVQIPRATRLERCLLMKKFARAQASLAVVGLAASGLVLAPIASAGTHLPPLPAG